MLTGGPAPGTLASTPSLSTPDTPSSPVNTPFFPTSPQPDTSHLVPRVLYLFHFLDGSEQGILTRDDIRALARLSMRMVKRLATSEDEAQNAEEIEADPQQIESMVTNFLWWEGEPLDFLTYEQFVVLVEDNSQISSWLNHLDETNDPSFFPEQSSLVDGVQLHTLGRRQLSPPSYRNTPTDSAETFGPDDGGSLRHFKERDLVTLELERMGVVSLPSPSPPTADMAETLRRANGDHDAGPSALNPLTGLSLAGEAKPSLEAMQRGDSLRQSGGLGGSGGLRTSGQIRISTGAITGPPVSRTASFSGRIRGPITVRRAKATSGSLNSPLDSPFAIDYDSIKLKGVIGRGTFATVHAAEWLHLPVAVKIFHDQQIWENEKGDASQLETRNREISEYLKEIEVLSQLRHPNVLLYMGACVTPNRPICIVSELWNGGSVDDLLHGESAVRLTPLQVIHLAIGVARGMVYLHSSTPLILHRDLKASNILVDKNFTNCVICDFGLSRLGGDMSNAPSHPQKEDNVGTPYTMAPEIMDGSSFTPAADVYSFAIVLWEMWTGKVPFQGLKPMQLMFHVFAEGTRPPISPADFMHEAIEDLIVKCWDADSLSRPSFDSILDVLESEILQHELEVLSRDMAVPESKPETPPGQALMEWIYGGDAVRVKEIIDLGADVNFMDYDKRTPLHIAAAEGREEIVGVLLQHGAHPSAQDRWGSTPMTDARRGKNKEVMRLLMQVGGVERATAGTQNLLHCMELMEGIHRGSIEVVKQSLEDGALATFCDYDHRTPLHIAASEGHPEIARLLIESGASLDARDRWGSTPLHDAQRSGHTEVQMIIELSAEKSRLRRKSATEM